MIFNLNIQRTSPFYAISFMALIIIGVFFPASSKASDTNDLLVSPELLRSIQSVDEGAFFNSKIEYPDQIENFFNDPNSNELSKDRDKVNLEKYRQGQIRVAKAAHYEKVGNELCGQISDTYLKSLEGGIKSTYTFSFFEDLSKAIEASGGYTLPLRSTDGFVSVKFQNTNWDKETEGMGGNATIALAYNLYAKQSKFKANLNYQENGIIQLNANSKNLEELKRFESFIRFAEKNPKLKILNQSYLLDMVQPYLFIFRDNKVGANGDAVYFYIDVPYRIERKDIGTSFTLSKRDNGKSSACQKKNQINCKNDADHKPEVVCKARSTSLMVSRAQDQTKFKNHEALGMVLGGAPLGVPFPEGLIKRKSYQLSSDNIANPSLQCWLKLTIGLSYDDTCKSPEYGIKYLKMLNNDICVRDTGVSKVPKVIFPITVEQFSHDYLSVKYNHKCDPEPYPAQ